MPPKGGNAKKESGRAKKAENEAKKADAAAAEKVSACSFHIPTHFIHANFTSLPKTCNTRYIQRSASHASFVSAAIYLGRKFYSWILSSNI